MTVSDRRRRRAIAAVVSSIVAATVLTVAPAVPASAQDPGTTAPTTSTPPPPRTTIPPPLPPLLGVNAPILPRTVTTMDMFTPTVGVAIAHVPALAPGGRYYLVRTVDGGRKWRVAGSLGARMAPVPTIGGEPSMAFVSPTEGYVTLGGYSHRTFFTDDGGRSWSLVMIPGTVNGEGPLGALALVGHALWMTTTTCRGVGRRSTCGSDLVTLAVGRLTPATVERIPAPSRVGYSSLDAQTATLLARPDENEGLFTEQYHPTILETVDDGRSWTEVDDPCPDLGAAGLVSSTPGDWILYCNQDMGMSQGPNQLWVTTDGGADWVLIAAGGPGFPSIGTFEIEISGGFSISGNGRVLWLLGMLSGVAYSTDGGTDWKQTQLNTDGSAAAQIVTLGATEAWLPEPGIGLYRTLNGVTWTRLA